MSVVNATTIIEARQYVATKEAAGEQMDFKLAVLGSAGVTPAMIREWVDPCAQISVEWCRHTHPNPLTVITCPDCGLPVYWPDIEGEL